jgi:hypothetical protein
MAGIQIPLSGNVTVRVSLYSVLENRKLGEISIIGKRGLGSQGWSEAMPSPGNAEL